MHSSTSTRSVTYGRITSRHDEARRTPRRGRAISSVLCASSTKSSSPRRCTSSSSASASSCRSCAVSECPASERAPSSGARARSSSTCSTTPGPPHLDDDLAAGRQQRAVRLGDRRRRERLRVDADEHVVAEVVAQITASISANGTGGTASTSCAELLDVDVRQQIRPRREELAELDDTWCRAPRGLRGTSARSFAGRFALAGDADLRARTRRMPALAARPARRVSARRARSRRAPTSGVMPPLAGRETPRRWAANRRRPVLAGRPPPSSRRR